MARNRANASGGCYRYRAGPKPGSVLAKSADKADLARWLSIWDVCYQTPLAAHYNGARKNANPPLLRPCTQPGFTWPAPLDTAGALLPHPCTLTCGPKVTSNGPSAVCFCGTLLTVARTGRYPASSAFREPGLSSDVKTGLTPRQHPQPLSQLYALQSISLADRLASTLTIFRVACYPAPFRLFLIYFAAQPAQGWKRNFINLNDQL